VPVGTEIVRLPKVKEVGLTPDSPSVFIAGCVPQLIDRGVEGQGNERDQRGKDSDRTDPSRG
jgi:hypothetical protein